MWIDGGYFVLPKLSVGGYFSYGPGQVGIGMRRGLLLRVGDAFGSRGRLAI